LTGWVEPDGHVSVSLPRIMILHARAAVPALLLLVGALFAACSDNDGGGATASPTAGEDETDGLVELELVAEDTRFDRDRLEAPAASEVSVTLDNRDSIEHNFSLYQSAGSTEALFEGPLLPGPSFLTYQFTAPETPGAYPFRCDVHPDVMNGEFVVVAGSSSPPPGS
jgi:plastocyanin